MTILYTFSQKIKKLIFFQRFPFPLLSAFSDMTFFIMYVSCVWYMVFQVIGGNFLLPIFQCRGCVLSFTCLGLLVDLLLLSSSLPMLKGFFLQHHFYQLLPFFRVFGRLHLDQITMHYASRGFSVTLLLPFLSISCDSMSATDGTQEAVQQWPSHLHCLFLSSLYTSHLAPHFPEGPNTLSKSFSSFLVTRVICTTQFECFVLCIFLQVFSKFFFLMYLNVTVTEIEREEERGFFHPPAHSCMVTMTAAGPSQTQES